MAIKNNYLVEKRNVLNEVRSNNMTLQELRFFSIYLAKINARDVSTRVVRFPIADFKKIMDLGRVNADYLMSVAKDLLKQVVSVPSETGGSVGFQLFKECRVDRDENDNWYVEIDAHDKALPLMFDFKDKYFTYELWNALQLKSKNQLRMYELLKQYEKIGERVISLNDLKEMLGINASDYPRYGNFKTRVLDSCKEALEKYTDIKFSYEPTGKKGSGVKVKALKFTISKNENYVDVLSLDEFIDVKSVRKENIRNFSEKNSFWSDVPFADNAENTQPDSPFCPTDDEPDDDIKSQIIYTEFRSERLAFLAGACQNEFDDAEMQIINDLLTEIMPRASDISLLHDNKYDYELKLYDCLKRHYDELELQAGKREIKSRFGYLKKILESELAETRRQ